MRPVLGVLAALLLAAVPARAQDSDEGAGAAPVVSSASVADSSAAASALLASLAASTEPLSADQVIAGVEAADAGLKTLHCTFTQSLKIPGYDVDQKGAGELWFRKEKELRVEQTLPRKQTVVSNGKTLWMYSPDSNQVIVEDWTAFNNSQAARGLVQFGNYTHLRDHYEVAVSSRAGASGAPEYVLTLKPKEAQEIPYTLTLTVTPPDFLPRRTRMDLNDTVVETVLDGVETNVPLNDKLFTFSVPSGAVVIRPGASQTP